MKKYFTLLFILIALINGYSNFSTSPVILTQPAVTIDCATQSAIIKVTDNGGNNYKWEVSTNGGSIWTSVTNSIIYSGAATNTLTINGTTNGYQYRVELTSNTNGVSLLSDITTIMMDTSPITNNVTMEKCDNDFDGKVAFDLTTKNNLISSNSFMETFTYYTSSIGASTANPSDLISNPTAYINPIPFVMDVWVRVVNPSNCFDIAKIALNVEALPIVNFIGSYASCDDNQDGMYTFNTAILESTLLSGQTNKIVSYFDQNGLPLPSPFPTTFTTPTQMIKAVVSNNSMLGCYSETFISFIVDPLPFDSVIVTGNDLTAIESGASYQWYKCPNTLLDGETNQSYAPTVNGDYKVEIASLVSSCSVVSDCVTFSSLGVKKVNADSKFVLYPNPTTGILNIESNIEDSFNLVNQLGQVVKTVKVNVGTNKVNLENLVDGVYFLKNQSGENQVVKKIVKK